MSKHFGNKFETSIARTIFVHHPAVPINVVNAEIRYRLGQEAMRMRRNGNSLAQISETVGYSRAYLAGVMIPVAEQHADPASEFVAPLDTWLATDAAHDPAPAPEKAIEPESVVTTELDVGCDGVRGGMFVGGNPGLTSMLVGPREWILRLDGNDLSLTEATIEAIPEPAPPTDADFVLYALVQDRATLLSSAVRMLQCAAGIEPTGTVDDATMSVVAGIAAWQGRPRPLMDAVTSFVDGRRASDRLTEAVLGT